jgi:hypothetical protein
VRDERLAPLVRGQHRFAHVDAQHGLHPRVFAHALVHHVFERRARTRLWPEPHLLVGYLRPHR